MPYYYLYRNQAISGPPKKTLSRWDHLNKRRRVVGIGAIDAHARGIWPLKIFPYDQIFQTIVTYIVTPQPLSSSDEYAKKQLLENLKNGHCFFAYEQHAEAKGFQFYIETHPKKLEMGDRARYISGSKLYVELPERCRLRIIHDSKVLHSGVGKSWNMEIKKPGVYRIETFYKNKPWIFSNPVVLTDE